MEQKNYYKILGVSHKAGVGEITKAFYELARKYDPHINPGNREAEENFKEVNEAYEVLSNLEKRRKYDAFLSKWPPDLDPQKQPPRDSGFSDFFEVLFGSKPKNPGPRKGENIEKPVELTLQEAYIGTTRTFNIQSTEVCSRCLRMGKVDNKVCANCNGQGTVVRNKRIQVKIRAGAETGSKIRVAGEGQPGTGGGPKGDLFLIISVKLDPLFERKGDDLYTNVEVERNIAINGGEVAVLTPDRRKLMLAIPAGTQGDRLFRLAGKGMPRLRAEGNGNLYARVKVIPGTIVPDVEKQPATSDLPPMQLAPESDRAAGFTRIADPLTIVGPERVKEHLVEERRGMNSRVGQQLGNYRLNRLLGSGGFADVYLAAHIYLKTLTAIKILHTHLTQQDLEDFTREAQTIALLKHPHIIRVLDFGIDGTVPYLVMDYAPRGTLRQQHPRGGIVSLTTVVSYLKQVASALQYAHDAKLIHRDVKPENMLLDSNNEIVLSDFGIAVVAHSTSSLKTQNSFGTIHYMAPEHIHGKPRPASDQYSLGVIAYEWLTGSRPFNGSSYIEIAMQHIDAPPQSPRERISTIPVDVEQVILKALSKDPSQRYSSVQDFATALEQASQ